MTPSIFMAHNMHKMAENYYHMPKSECILFRVGVFFHAIKRYKEASEYYQKALPFVVNNCFSTI